MNRIQVQASKSYDVIIGYEILDYAAQLIKTACSVRRLLIVTDDVVDALYSEKVRASLEKGGIATDKFVIEHGEASKNSENYLKILYYLAEKQFTRSDGILALGGGVVGDLGGFAAATYMRGITFIQAPTTLLAMVDSSVGGKTAIDLPSGKNMVGAFYQPSLVLCDLRALNTLETSILQDGSAEVIKYGFLADASLAGHLLHAGLSFDRERVVTRCVDIKRMMVEKDELDHGDRRFLNFGHTIGHAIEQKSNYQVSHGRAVAMGMAEIARLAVEMGECDEDCANTIVNTINRFNLPTVSPYPLDELFDIVLSDKKRSGDKITIVLPKAVGHCTLKTMKVDQLKQILGEKKA